MRTHTVCVAVVLATLAGSPAAIAQGGGGGNPLVQEANRLDSHNPPSAFARPFTRKKLGLP